MKHLLIFLKLSIWISLFVFSARTQTIVHLDGKFGLADEKGAIIVKPVYDTVYQGDETLTTFFILKNKGKYGFAYRKDFDSTTWLPEKERIWQISELIYDSLIPMDIGLYRNNHFGYFTMTYKKNNLWGMIYTQAKTDSGDGIFPELGFHVLGLGRLRVTEPKYDAILRKELADLFYTTYVNGKYGFWHVGNQEEYPAIFEEDPIFISERTRYVKKGGKWGVVKFERRDRGYEYILPCECNQIAQIRTEEDYINKETEFRTFGCSGHNDILTVADTKTMQAQTVLIDGKPYTIDTTKHLIFKTSFKNNAALIFIEEGGMKLTSDSADLSKSIIIYDLKNKKALRVLAEKDALYKVFIEANPVIRKVTYDKESNMFVNEFSSLLSEKKITKKTEKYARFAVFEGCGAHQEDVLRMIEVYPEFRGKENIPKKYHKKTYYIDLINGKILKRKKC